MVVRIHKPGDVLSPYIENYMCVDINWEANPSLPRLWRLIPYGKPSILFLYGDPHQFRLAHNDTQSQTTAKAFIVGQLRSPLWLEFAGHTKMIKIQFKPTGIRRFMDFDMSDLTNIASVDLDTMWGAPVQGLLEQLEISPGVTQSFALIESFFKNHLLHDKTQTQYVDYAIEQFELSMGNISIAAIEKKLHISGRHLERMFKKNIGLSPAEFRKLTRLNHALAFLDNHPGTSLTSLAHTIGYYDQAHFSNDFKHFAGIAPSKLFTAKSQELFVTHGKCFLNNLS